MTWEWNILLPKGQRQRGESQKERKIAENDWYERVALNSGYSFRRNPKLDSKLQEWYENRMKTTEWEIICM